MPDLQHSRAGRATSGCGAVFALTLRRSRTDAECARCERGRCYLPGRAVPREAREAIRQKTQGEEYQPTDNHSKLTDSNDCTDYFSCFNFLLLFRLPSSLCLLPDILVRLFLCRLATTGTHVKHVADRRASYLRCKEFRHSGGRLRVCDCRSEPLFSSPFRNFLRRLQCGGKTPLNQYVTADK